MAITKDHRTKDKRPLSEVKFWLVATDKSMSGWGNAPDTSYIAYPADLLTDQEYQFHLDWMKDRPSWIRVRLNYGLPRLRDGYHLSICDIPERIKS